MLLQSQQENRRTGRKVRFSGEKMQAAIGGKKHGGRGVWEKEFATSIRIDE